jgi:hypothetical protein
MRGGILGKGMTMEMEEAVVEMSTCVQAVNYSPLCSFRRALSFLS